MSSLRLSFSCSARKRISPRGSAPALLLNAVEQGHRGHPSAHVCARSRGNPRLFAAGGDHLAAERSRRLLPFAHRRTAQITNGVLSKKVFPAGTGRQSGSRDELFYPCAWEGNAPRFSQRGGSSFKNRTEQKNTIQLSGACAPQLMMMSAGVAGAPCSLPWRR